MSVSRWTGNLADQGRKLISPKTHCWVAQPSRQPLTKPPRTEPAHMLIDSDSTPLHRTQCSRRHTPEALGLE